MGNQWWRGLRVLALGCGLAAAILAPQPAGYALTEKAKEELKEIVRETAADWRAQAKEAALKYADDKKDEFVKEKSKAAIFALYKKLYKSGASKTLTRALGEVALSAPELNKLAEETAEAYGSGDPEKIRAASENVAVKFGEQISRLASNQETRKLLGEIIGSADKVREISGVLGQAAAGTDEGRREAAKYLGELVISVTPAAAVVGFYQSAYGVMKYANDKFVDSQLEELYQDYKSGKLTEAGLKEKLDRAPYNAIVRGKMSELRGEKAADIADAARHASDALKERLTRTTNDEVIGKIIASFDGRMDKERADAAATAEREKAEKEANTILEKLNDVAATRHGSDWHKSRSYDLDRFTKAVRDQIRADGVLDPNNPVHVKKVSEVLSTALVHGKGSKEHTKLLGELKAIKDKLIADNQECIGEGQALALRLWQKGLRLVDQKKVAAAIPLFKQSLEVCPDDRRAAQLAELTKLAKVPAETATQDYDGTYAGSILWKPADKKYEKDAITGSLTLTIKGGAITGTMQARKYFKDGKNSINIAAQITGRAQPSGQITATIQGKSSYEGELPPEPEPAERGSAAAVVKAGTWAVAQLVKGLNTYPFEGSFTGRVGEGDVSGSYSVTKLGGKQPTPNYRVGTWKAARK